MVKFTNYIQLLTFIFTIWTAQQNFLQPYHPRFFGRDCTRPFFSISGCSPHRSKLRVHVMVPPANPPRLLNPRRRPWLQRMAGFSMEERLFGWENTGKIRGWNKGVFLTLLRKEIGQKMVYRDDPSQKLIKFYIRTYPTRIQQRFMFMSYEPFSIFKILVLSRVSSSEQRKKPWDYGGFHENPHAVSKHSPYFQAASWAIRSPLHHSNILKPGFGWHNSSCCHRHNGLTRLWDPPSLPTSSSYIIHFVFCLSVF